MVDECLFYKDEYYTVKFALIANNCVLNIYLLILLK
jgi:hypothetical protein